jgi:hypothetical protein
VTASFRLATLLALSVARLRVAYDLELELLYCSSLTGKFIMKVPLRGIKCDMFGQRDPEQN